MIFATVLAAAPLADAAVSFNRDIRPIMSDTCFRCHGPDKSSRMAGLRLDIRDEALKPRKAGIIPIVPGDPDQSAIIQRIFAKDARIMPPPFAHKELTAAQKETIRRWVAEGAIYEGHWAYQPVKRPAVPDSQAPNPIDAFIQARLAREGLKPSPEADRATLIRRVTLDLTGLPPTMQEVDAFVKDGSPGAYEKVVDRLLASPRYAEQQAMHWLDAVRYADTCGFHGDNPFPAWPYRDYVLRAFRDNKPFDEFTREQLAGDLIPNATVEQKVASAYNRLTRTSAEGGLQPLEYLAKYGADRARTVSVVWLGSTMGCAECHDHKFDPFLSKDFYSMKAFFADIKETGLVPDRGLKAWGSQLALPTAEQQEKLDRLNEQLAEAKRNLEEKAQSLGDRQKEWEKETLSRFEAGQLNWLYQRPVSAQSKNGAKLTVYNDAPVDGSYYLGTSLVAERKPGNGLVVASGPNPDNEVYMIKVKPGVGTWTALGLEVVQDDSLPGGRLARGSDRVVVSEVDADLSGRGKLEFALATSSTTPGFAPEYPAMAAIDGHMKTGWGFAGPSENRSLFLALRFAAPVQTQADSEITIRVHQDSEYRRATIGRLRVALSAGEHSWPEPENPAVKSPPKRGLPAGVLKALRTPESDRTEEQRQALLTHFAWASPELQPLEMAEATLEAEVALLRGAIPRVVVTEADEPRETRILARGNFMDESGAVVEPAIPTFLGKLDTGGRRATRLDLANWIVSPSQSAHGARFRKPALAAIFRHRHFEDARRSRLAGRVAVASGVAGLAGGGVHVAAVERRGRARLGREAHDPDDRDEPYVPAVFDEQSEARRARSGESAAGAPEPLPRGCGGGARYRARSLRPAGGKVRRSQRQALSAGRISGRAEFSQTRVFGQPRRRPVPARRLHLLAANVPASQHGEFRCADAGRVHGESREFRYAAAGAGSAERSDLRGGGARVRAAHFERGRPHSAAAPGLGILPRVSRKPTAAERSALAVLYRKSLARFAAAPADAKQLIQVGDAPLSTNAAPAELAAMTTVARAILNLHETITRN